MARYSRQPKVSLIKQRIRLQQTYPELIDDIRINKNELTCIIRLQPTSESIVYKTRIWFKLGYWPQARIVEPKEIARFNGLKPHHLYNKGEEGKERLCVFYPKGNEWNDDMYLAEAYVPWVVTWLSAYEIWQITGKWVYPEYKDESPTLSKRRSNRNQTLNNYVR